MLQSVGNIPNSVLHLRTTNARIFFFLVFVKCLIFECFSNIRHLNFSWSHQQLLGCIKLKTQGNRDVRKMENFFIDQLRNIIKYFIIFNISSIVLLNRLITVLAQSIYCWDQIQPILIWSLCPLLFIPDLNLLYSIQSLLWLF